MKVGIAGFSGSGKSTVFQWLTGIHSDPAASQRGQLGIADIPDERLDWLSHHFEPKKTTHAKLEFLDTPGLLATERRDNPAPAGDSPRCERSAGRAERLRRGALADELRRFREELLFADLEIVTNRISKLESQLKKPRPQKEKDSDLHELALLRRIVVVFEQGQGATALGLSEDEEKLIRSFQLLTLKSELVYVNIGDDRIGKPLPEELLQLAPNAIQSPAKLELELDDLAEDDRQVFMQDLGLTGSSRGEELRTIYYSMGQIVFFTVGEDECRAWVVARGADAVTGAAQIHTDLAKGFVRGSSQLRGFQACRVNERSEVARGLPTGRQDIHRA